MPGSLLFICSACIRVSSVCLILLDARAHTHKHIPEEEIHRGSVSVEPVCARVGRETRVKKERGGDRRRKRYSCKEDDDTRACCAGGYHAAWSEEPGHTEILSRTSASIRRHWRAGVSISNNLTIVSARLVMDRCALCRGRRRVCSRGSRLSSSSPLFHLAVSSIYTFARSFCSTRTSLSLSLYAYTCVCVGVRVLGRCAAGLWRGILVNDSGANTARGNIKNVPWDSVGLEEVWRQKRCWHPPPPTMPCNT